MRSEVVFRPATDADAQRYYGRRAHSSFRGFVAELNGELVGLAGVYYQDGVPIAFSEINPHVRSRRRDIVRGVKMLMQIVDTIKGPVYAVANPAEPTAPYLLAKLGWKPTGLLGPLGETLVRG